jgi:hypothetical protein
MSEKESIVVYGILYCSLPTSLLEDGCMTPRTWLPMAII